MQWPVTPSANPPSRWGLALGKLRQWWARLEQSRTNSAPVSCQPMQSGHDEWKVICALRRLTMCTPLPKPPRLGVGARPGTDRLGETRNIPGFISAIDSRARFQVGYRARGADPLRQPALCPPARVRRRQLARNLVRDRFRPADEHAVAVPADFERTWLVRC
jgi:hypothetical protein